MLLRVDPDFNNNGEDARELLRSDVTRVLQHMTLYHPKYRSACAEAGKLLITSTSSHVGSSATFDAEMAPFVLEDEELSEFSGLSLPSLKRASPGDTVITCSALVDVRRFEDFKAYVRKCAYITLRTIEDQF